MTDDDIDEGLKKKWIEVLNPNNSELINQQMNRFANLTKLLEFETNNVFALRYRGETYYMIKKYEESLADLNSNKYSLPLISLLII